MKAKILLVMFFIILFTIFVSQNTKIIDLNFLTWKLQLSTIVVISITFFIGMIAGFLIVSIFSVKQKKEKKIPQDTNKAGMQDKPL